LSLLPPGVARTLRLGRLGARRTTSYVVHRARRATTRQQDREALDAQFAIRSTEDVVKELGQMKGVMMKAGQMLGWVAEGLPPEAAAALASLQADGPPMAPSLAAKVIEQELGKPPEKIFRTWNAVPIAAASIGQVHQATMKDGRKVAVKVQYPGIADAMTTDLGNAEMLYRLFGAFALKGFDAKGVVDELRARVADELDYTIEATNQTAFVERYRDHPFIRIPAIIPELSTSKVLVSEWVEGMSFDTFLATANEPTKQKAAEVVFRFAQQSVHRYLLANGDPHAGNYRFHEDGTVTFLDFGMVKKFDPDEWARLAPSLDAMVFDRDPERTVKIMEETGFLTAGHGLDPKDVWAYVSQPYVPFLLDSFTYEKGWVGETLRALLDRNGPYAEVMKTVNMPPSFVVLDRVVWGVSSLMGRLHATAPWRSILAEYRHNAAPQTALGQAEEEWRRTQKEHFPE
jgi:predicted unusual protein kinase regulating ubiquinone biosynthesis (AarF/ABC1/UbiB family)